MSKKKDEYVVSQEFVGSTVWIIFWIIFCFPIAIFYYFSRRAPVKKKVIRQ